MQIGHKKSSINQHKISLHPSLIHENIAVISVKWGWKALVGWFLSWDCAVLLSEELVQEKYVLESAASPCKFPVAGNDFFGNLSSSFTTGVILIKQSKVTTLKFKHVNHASHQENLGAFTFLWAIRLHGSFSSSTRSSFESSSLRKSSSSAMFSLSTCSQPTVLAILSNLMPYTADQFITS